MSDFSKVLVGALFLVMFSTAVHAQKPGDGNVDIGDVGGGFSGLPVDLLPPGARSLGLAGAFTGVSVSSLLSDGHPAIQFNY